MIRCIKRYKIPFLLTLFLFAIHLISKDFNNPYERPIAGDAQAYYAYLPALFIYQDLSYNFVEDINTKYYPESHQKSFLKPVGNGKVNKTFPGVAILYLPFFLIAHGLALLFGLDADGYSLIYQFLFDIGLWFYLLMGLIFLKKALHKLNFSTKTANWTIAILLLSTNMVFYTVYDQSVTHIYNFFMINALIFYLLSFQEKMQFYKIGIVFFLLALIAITRPTNVLVLGLILFFIPFISFYKTTIIYIIKIKNLWRTLLISGGVLLIPFLLWKLQTGNWIVYSYGKEGFNFSDPHFSEFLFSYLKGWFTYTPLALFILIIGFVLLFKQNKTRFSIGISFYLLSIYIFSSWWCWYYGAGMGQRVMIDHYILLAFLLALILQKIKEKKGMKIVFFSIAFLCIGLNFLQAYQIRHGILAGGSATEQQYWDTILEIEKKARVYPHDHWVLEGEKYYSFEVNSKALIKGKSHYAEETWMIQVTESKPFSASIDLNITALRKGSKLIIGFEARSRNNIEKTRAVLDIDGELHVFGLDSYLKKDEWVKIEYIIEPKATVIRPLILYFWNAGSLEKVEFKNLWTKHYFSEDYL